VCTIRTASTTLILKEKAAYSITKDDEEVTITYDLTYKGLRLASYVRKLIDTQDELNEELYNSDLHDLSDFAMSVTNHSDDLPNIYINDQLDSNLTSLNTWYKDLLLDDNLPTSYALATNPIVREPRTYKEAINTP
jgi:hypothetical protein